MGAGDSIVVLGLLGQFPLAGIAWQLIHHLAGLQGLGFHVYYVEDTGTAPYDPRLRSPVADCTYSLQVIAHALARIGMEHAWAYRDGLTGQWHGLSANRVQEIFSHAVCTINLCGASNPATLTYQPKGKFVYLETDPVLLQIQLAQGDPAAVQFLAAHDAHVTYGENLGEADCPIPLSRFQWRKTRPPIAPDFWPVRADGSCRRFTTIGTWHNRGKDVYFRGETYYWSKHLNFLRLIDLPAQTEQELELATEIYEPTDLAAVRRHGWFLTSSLAVSRDIDVYRDYICGSRGEFTVSKDVVTRTRSGWFSDRSVSYLAAGKPVVTQETGFSKYIPTGRGLFAFSSTEEVLTALDAINCDYTAHARAAREIAAEYFDSRKLLTKLLQDVGVG